MKAMSALIDAHLGRPAVVIGGGMSAPKQLEAAPADAVFLSANQHGCLLRTCDYIVCCDDLSTKKLMGLGGAPVDIRQFKVPIISSRRRVSDYQVMRTPVNNSGALAAWAAWVMGCAPIIPIGVDLYKGGTYFHNPGAKSTGRGLTTSQHMARWQRLKQEYPEAMVRALGGPLLEIFPRYDPAEPAGVGARGKVRSDVSGKIARLVKPWPQVMRGAQPGQEIEVSQAELQHGMRKHFLEQVPA